MSTYWILIAGSAAVCIALMAARKNQYGLRAGTAAAFCGLAVPLALLAGRGAYFLVSLDWIVTRGVPFWRMTEGQFMLYGALLGGMGAAFIAGRLCRQKTADILDAAAASAALMIAAERLCEYLIEMGFGVGIEEWFDPYSEWSMIAWENPELLYRFPFGVQNYYGTWRFAVNLPEAIWAIAIAVILLFAQKRKTGAATVRMITLYAAGQVVLESMRRDEVLKWSFVQVNQLLSAVILLGMLLLCWRMQPAKERKIRELLISGGLMILCAGIVMLMEFALDQKIFFLFWMRADVSYLVEILCCIGMAMIVMKAWRKAFPPDSMKERKNA